MRNLQAKIIQLVPVELHLFQHHISEHYSKYIICMEDHRSD